MSDDRAILHVDMDAFYASVEIMDDPALAGKPVIVGGTPESRGVVSAASYEARHFGIHSAMSSARAHKLCPHGVFILPRMSRYAEISERIHGIMSTYTPLIEPISLDEAFLDVTGSRALFGSGEHIGREIRRRILEEIGLVASVGVAPNKFLAKLASDLEKPDGFVVMSRDTAAARLAPLPVGRIWGVGKVAAEKLSKLGVFTIGDVANAPQSLLDRHFGAYAQRLHNLSLGLDERPVVSGGEARSIGAENTFAVDIGDAATLRAELDRLCERVGQRVRRNGLVSWTVHVKARYADFTTVTRAMTLTEPTSQTPVIRDTARELLEHRLGRDGRALRLVGVSVSNLVRLEETQPTLFEDPGRRRNRALDGVMDRLQERFGGDVIHRGRGRNRETR